MDEKKARLAVNTYNLIDTNTRLLKQLDSLFQLKATIHIEATSRYQPSWTILRHFDGPVTPGTENEKIVQYILALKRDRLKAEIAEANRLLVREGFKPVEIL